MAWLFSYFLLLRVTESSQLPPDFLVASNFHSQMKSTISAKNLSPEEIRSAASSSSSHKDHSLTSGGGESYWLVSNFFSTSGCSGSPTYSSGTLLSECTLSEWGYSSKTSCSLSGGSIIYHTEYYFSSTDCTGEPYPLSYYAGETACNTNSNMECVVMDEPWIRSPAIVTMGYDNETCCGALYNSYTAQLTEVCTATGIRSSYQYSCRTGKLQSCFITCSLYFKGSIDLISYSTDNCRGTVSSVQTLPLGSCGDSLIYGSIASEQFCSDNVPDISTCYQPTGTPTALPSVSPKPTTATPTSAPSISFQPTPGPKGVTVGGVAGLIAGAVSLLLPIVIVKLQWRGVIT